jgi:predicted enzyme related to lactoylglutathione lyase
MERETIAMPVELGYLTIPVPSVPRARAFFEALFGWSFDLGDDVKSAHVGNTKLPLGLSTGGPTDYAGLYFKVSDLQAMSRTLVALGGDAGAVTESPSGLSAVCRDDQGTIFSLWQPAPGYED